MVQAVLTMHIVRRMVRVYFVPGMFIVHLHLMLSMSFVCVDVVGVFLSTDLIITQ